MFDCTLRVDNHQQYRNMDDSGCRQGNRKQKGFCCFQMYQQALQNKSFSQNSHQTLRRGRMRRRSGRNLCSHQASALALPHVLNQKEEAEGRRKGIQSYKSDPYIKRAVGVGRKSDKAMKCHCSQGLLQSDLFATQKAAV